MRIHEFEIVIFTQYGGFHLTKEMAEWLQMNKGWTIAEDKKQQQEHLISLDGDFFYPNRKYWTDSDYVDLRMNLDFIECLKTLKAKYANIDHRDRRDDMDLQQLFGMSIRQCTVFVDINNVYDGKEEVVVNGLVD